MRWWLVLACAGALAGRQIPIKTYTTADGLARNAVQRILRDSRGYIWLCTREGLSRFDGYQFTNYGPSQGLPHSAVSDIIETHDGAYWIGTPAGLCRVKPEPNRPTHCEVIASRGAKPLVITSLLEDSAHRVWVGSADGLFGWNEGRRAIEPIDIGMPRGRRYDTTIETLMQDRAGSLWIGAKSGVYRLSRDGRTLHLGAEDGLPNSWVSALAQTHDGSIWAGTKRGLCRLSEPSADRIAIESTYMSGEAIQALLASVSGKLWVGTDKALVDFSSRPQVYGASNGLVSSNILSLAEERGALWIGSDSGVMRSASGGFITYTAEDGLDSNRIVSIFENRAGELCVKTAGRSGIARFDGRRFAMIHPNVPRSVNYWGWGWNQLDLQDGQGDWWIPTGLGLIRFAAPRGMEQLASARPSAVYNALHGLPGDNIFRAFEDSRGDIWIATVAPDRNGLARWSRVDNAWRTFSDEQDWFRKEPVTSFGEDRSGNVWIGLRTGLARFRLGRFTLYTTADGLAAGQIRGMYLDRSGRLWAASNWGGVSRIDSPDADRPVFVNYTTAQDLSSNDAECVTGDELGRIYIGTGRGVDRLTPATGRMRHYSTADGLAPGEPQVAFRDHTGGVWFGLSGGLSQLVPERGDAAGPPPVRITAVRVRGVPHPMSELGVTRVSSLELKPSENQLQVEVVGTGFGPGETPRYQYMLSGADDGWSQPTVARTLNYASLSPGAYRFMARAIDADGMAGIPAELSFRVLPPVWRRWWFQCLLVLAVASTVYAAHRYRVGRLLELERVRTRIATDLHDDIGSSLSQISILSEVVTRGLNGDNSAMLGPLSTIASTSRELVDSMSDIVWAIDPNNDHLSNLAQRMRRFASDVFTGRGIAFQFQGPGEDCDFVARADLRRPLFLVFKEAVHNMVRHSGCTEARIQMRVEAGALVVTVSDNGRGFDPGLASTGHGLRSMRGRMASLGGAVEIASRPGDGAILTFRIPMQ